MKLSRSIRAFLEQSPTEVGEEIVLPKKEAVHLSRVLRIKPGGKLECIDGRGGGLPANAWKSNDHWSEFVF